MPEADGYVALLGSPTGRPIGDKPYRMRGFDQTLGRVVYWSSDEVDDAGAEYAGPGPVVDVMVFYRCYDS